jgi:catechol 2,3-dioxygenase-like lactoylglutathione lyase family enzyme
MLGDQELIAFVATMQPEKALIFYRDVLDLELLEDAWFSIIFRAGKTRLHIQKVKEFKPHPFTAIGWGVGDIKSKVANLAAKGIKCERFPGMEQDEAGIWTTPDGAGKVCWFKDPDGNVLSLTQFS